MNTYALFFSPRSTRPSHNNEKVKYLDVFVFVRMNGVECLFCDIGAVFDDIAIVKKIVLSKQVDWGYRIL